MAIDPTIAVIICTRNRPEALQETLRSIWDQIHPPDELIVIDDGDLPAEISSRISASASSRGIRFTSSKTKQPGLTPGRHLAARLSGSDVLFYLDDDVTCDRDCVLRVAQLFRDERVAGVTARVDEPRFSATPSARLYQIGYRIAAWWRVRPRRRPSSLPPSILERPWAAVRAHWLSGAAMALLRKVVLENPFDERLSDYALGEDREMGYRLSERHWLLESRLASVVHRREEAERIDQRRLGFMTARNYLYILRKTCQPGVGDWLLIAWSLCAVAAMHLIWCLGGGRRGHALSLLGMCEGLRAAARESLGRCDPPQPTERSPQINSGVRTPEVQISSRLRSRSKSRRVLFVTNRLEPGGAELMLMSLVRRLPALGIEPHIACLKDAGPLAPQCRVLGVPVYDELLKHKTDLGVVQRIRRIIAEQSMDIVVAAHSGGDRMFWSTLAGRLSNTPVIVWSHWFPLPGQHHFERANRALYRFVHTFVALGHSQRLAMIRNEQVPAGKIAVIPNAIELDRFLSVSTTRQEVRRILGLANGQIAVAIIANLRREKRHDVFIHAARLLSRSLPQLRFLIIGDGPHRDAVQSAAAKSGLDHEVLRILGPRDDVPELLTGIDIACLCSDQECFSMTMLEAAASGVPFIGPNSGCMPDFLDHGRSGLLIDPADAVQLADAISELATNPERRRKLATAAQCRVLAEYGIETMVRSFADLFYGIPVRSEKTTVQRFWPSLTGTP